ncbi:MAG: methyltransferase domain-containing protein [Chromatiales bacterium]|nr:methyltransferase domain-containing protein [Chromatiales bacterium]
MSPNPPAVASDSRPAVAGLRDWFATPTGRRLARHERAAVRELLGNVFGYYLVQVGDPGWRDAALRDCRVRRKFVLDTTDTAPAAGADYERAAVRDSEWPLRADSIDAVVLPHTLDFSDSPHQVLREAERVLIGEGRLVVVGFSPWGRYGLRRWLTTRRQAPYNAAFIRLGRLADWLELLGMKIDTVRPVHIRPSREPARSRWPGAGLAAAYAVLAVRRRATLTPLRPRAARFSIAARPEIADQGRVPTPRSGPPHS